jgi:hypothetical protein
LEKNRYDIKNNYICKKTELMNQEQAYQIVEQALNAATTKGVYNLQDAANILAALNVVRPLCVTEKTNEDGI